MYPLLNRVQSHEGLLYIYLVKETHNTSPITLQPLEVNTQKAITMQSDPLFGHKNGPTLSFPSLFY